MYRLKELPCRSIPWLSLTLYCWGFSGFVVLSHTADGQSKTINPENIPAVQSPATERVLTLDRAIDLALDHNGELGVAKLDVQHYEALKAKARAQYLPKLTNSSEATYLTEREGVVLPPGSLGVFPTTGPVPAQTLRIDQGAHLTYASRTYLNQPTLQLFATHAMNHAAKMDVDTARLNVEDKSENTAIQVRQLYYEVLDAESQARAAEEEVATLQKSDQEAEAEVREGSALPLKELDVRANLLQAESVALKTRNAARDDRLALNNVMGVPLDSRFRLVDPDAAELSAGALPTRDEAVRLALAQQPQVLIAERKVDKAKAELRVAEDAFIPDLTLSAHQSYQVGIALLVRNYGVFQAQFSYNLFEGGARRAQVRSQRSLLAEAQLNLANLRRSTTVSIEAAYDNVESAELDLTAKQQAVVARGEGARVADSRYAHGEILASERDMTHAQLAEAEASRREAELNLSLARSQVKRLLGEIAR